MTEVSSALLAPPAPPHGSEPPGHPPDTPFSAVLDDHQARTAVAEGHQQKRQGADAGEPAIERDGDDAGTAPTDPVTPEASALAALLGGVPLPAGVKLTAVAIAAAPQGDASARAPAGAPGGATATAADASVTPMPTGPSVPAAATTLPLRPPLPAAAAAEGASPSTAAADQPVPATPPAATAVVRATRLADVLQAATARSEGAGSSGAAPATAAATTPPPATVAGAARSSSQAPDQGATNGSAPQPTAPAPVQPATASVASQGGAPVAATAPAHGVGLEHAVETVRLALRAAADRGVTHARISLTPRELGSIEVHLRQTSDGLVARVVAEHATAAQLLHDAGGELRRQLESQGLNLLRLDIGAQGEQRERPLAGGGAFAGGEGDGLGRDRGADDDPLAPLDGADQASTTTTLTLPNGALVDVLA